MYKVELHPHAQDQARALPLPALTPFLELRETLSLAPWDGDLLDSSNPDANILTRTFGPQRQGLVTYMIIEYRRHVEILNIAWIA